MATTAIVTGWTGTLFAKIACYTLPLIESYAFKHGALFACSNLHGSRPPSWHKIEILQQALLQVDMVAWIDTDVIIQQPDRNIFDELSNDAWQGIVEHSTEAGQIPNCGVWVLKKEMLPILNEIWNSGLYIDHPWWEQAAILEKMGYHVDNLTSVHQIRTELFNRTSWLGPEWNHHPKDERRVNDPHFRHITQYQDRVDVVRHYAQEAQINWNEARV